VASILDPRPDNPALVKGCRVAGQGPLEQELYPKPGVLRSIAEHLLGDPIGRRFEFGGQHLVLFDAFQVVPAASDHFKQR